MKKLACLVIGGLLSMPVMAEDLGYPGWIHVGKSNKSKINSYLVDTPCSQLSKKLGKYGWKPYRDPKNLPSELTAKNSLQKFFVKYKELQYCRGTGYGECYGKFHKGKYYLNVEYFIEANPEEFEDKSCRVSTYHIDTTPD